MTTYVGDNTANFFYGTAGADDISGLGGVDTLNGGEGRDRIDGGKGADQLDAGPDLAIDTVFGGAGNDYIRGGIGDKLFGDAGTDTFNIQLQTTADLVVDLRAVRPGREFRFDFGGLFKGFESGYLYFGSGDDTITASGRMPISLYGQGGSDRMIGRGGNDYMDGGATAVDDSDLLLGGGGADVLYGGTGDTLDGGDGADYFGLDLAASGLAYDVDLAGFAGGGTVDFADGTRLKGLESGLLHFGDMDDRVSLGDADGIIVNGRGGDDSLIGGAMADDLEGGLGDDLINGGAGFDSTYYWNSAVGVTVSLAVAGPQDTGSGLDTLVNIEGIVGSFEDDLLAGNARANHIGGLNGDDSLSGGAGVDTLIGGYTSTSSPDQDRITGGRDADELTGGAQADTFVYLQLNDSLAAAPDTITDLTSEDVIDLSAVDADTGTAGNQAFTLIVGAFTGSAGELRVRYDGVLSYIEMDVDGDTTADGVILALGDVSGFTNFVL